MVRCGQSLAVVVAKILWWSVRIHWLGAAIGRAGPDPGQRRAVLAHGLFVGHQREERRLRPADGAAAAATDRRAFVTPTRRLNFILWSIASGVIPFPMSGSRISMSFYTIQWTVIALNATQHTWTSTGSMKKLGLHFFHYGHIIAEKQSIVIPFQQLKKNFSSGSRWNEVGEDLSGKATSLTKQHQNNNCIKRNELGLTLVESSCSSWTQANVSSSEVWRYLHRETGAEAEAFAFETPTCIPSIFNNSNFTRTPETRRLQWVIVWWGLEAAGWTGTGGAGVIKGGAGAEWLGLIWFVTTSPHSLIEPRWRHTAAAPSSSSAATASAAASIHEWREERERTRWMRDTEQKKTIINGVRTRTTKTQKEGDIIKQKESIRMRGVVWGEGAWCVVTLHSLWHVWTGHQNGFSNSYGCRLRRHAPAYKLIRHARRWAEPPVIALSHTLSQTVA